MSSGADLTEVYDGKQKDMLEDEKIAKNFDRSVRLSKQFIDFDAVKLNDKKRESLRTTLDSSLNICVPYNHYYMYLYIGNTILTLIIYILNINVFKMTYYEFQCIEQISKIIC